MLSKSGSDRKAHKTRPATDKQSLMKLEVFWIAKETQLSEEAAPE